MTSAGRPPVLRGRSGIKSLKPAASRLLVTYRLAVNDVFQHVYLSNCHWGNSGVKNLEPAAAIITGIAIIGFGLCCYTIGIFPLINPGTGFISLVRAADDLMHFIVAVFVTIVAGLACAVWGLLKL